ncbi:MAG: xanthine dehydrogenase molybdopterin binding subunit, partial [Hyphomicrobiales bacterium]
MNLPPELPVLETKAESPSGAAGAALAHDSAAGHVSGRAVYIDDQREPAGTVHVAPGYAPAARGVITRLDLDKVRAAPGVVAVLTAADIPGD